MRHTRAGRNPSGTPATAYTQRTFGTPVASENLLIVTGSQQTTRNAVPIIWCHGLLTDGLYARRGPTYRSLQALAALGYVVLSGDFDGANTWGRPAAITKAESVLAWAVTNLGVRGDAVVWAGESMGSVLALNLARRNAWRTAAVWVRAPIADMQVVHDHSPTLAAVMDDAYVNHAGWVAALPDHNPQARAVEFTGLRDVMRLDATSSDEYIPVSVPTAFAAATGCTLVWHPGNHAANLATPVAEVADWLDQRVRLPFGTWA